MQKFTIILVYMLVCFTLFSGCTGKKDNDQNWGNSVEVDDTGDGNVDIDIGTMSSTDTLPNGFTYEFKDPDNADGIVVTPKG